MFCLLVLVVTALFFKVEASIMPNPIGALDVSETIPNGDIYVENDGVLEITCVVYGKSAEKDLKFTSDEFDVSPHVSKINATAIRLYIKNPKPQSQMYQCLKGNQIVDQNFVFVAVKPSEMKCISYNYDKLNCSFKSSELPSNTRYEARYELGGIRHNNRRWTSIENVTSFDYQQYFFVLDESTALQYRFTYGDMKLFLKITMEFPKSKRVVEYNLTATFNETKHVIPGPAANLKTLRVTSKEIQIFYELPKKMMDITYSLEHIILCSCKCGQKQWQNTTNFNTTLKSVTYNITNLPYAYSLCNVSVFLKASRAAYDNMWSTNATIEAIRTGSTIPEKPPQIFQGAFQRGEDSNETYVVIYWQEVPEELRNGPNFTYQIDVFARTGLEEILVKNTYGVVKYLNDSADSVLEIRSRNSDGFSIAKSTIVIPKKDENVMENLESFTQFSTISTITYLSWETSNITNEFQIFACDNWHEQTQLCNGQLEMINVIKSSKGSYYKVNHETLKKSKYALALKTLKNWSGLFWSKCSIDEMAHKGLPAPEIQLSITAVGISKIGLNWWLNCKDMVAPILGYVVSYCKTLENTQECDGEISNITVKGDRTVGSCEIENIEVDTPYLVWVSTNSVFETKQKSKLLPYYKEPKTDSALIYWTIPVGILFVILIAISSKMLYKKYKEWSDVSAVLPDGLPIGSIASSLNEKQFNRLRWNWIVKEIVPKSAPPPRLVPETSEASLQLSIGSQREDANTKPQILKPNHFISDVQKTKPYFQIGMETNKASPDEFSHNYMQTGEIPDLLQVKSPPYISFANANKTDAAPCAYVVAGSCQEQKETQLEHSTPYVVLSDIEKLKGDFIENPNEGCYIPYADNFEAENVSLLKDPNRSETSSNLSSKYVPLEAAPEEVPLLHLSQSTRPYVVLGETDSRAHTRPYVTVGDLLNGTYSDTPA